MRHKYATPGIILARYPLSEASVSLLVLTPEFGLVRARAQGARKLGAKLAPALQLLCESDLTLIHAKDGWRITGALPITNWFSMITEHTSRERAGRIATLYLRFLRGESKDAKLFSTFKELLTTLAKEEEHFHEAGECLAALLFLHALGLDEGEMPTLVDIQNDQSPYIARINRGLKASGL